MPTKTPVGVQGTLEEATGTRFTPAPCVVLVRRLASPRPARAGTEGAQADQRRCDPTRRRAAQRGGHRSTSTAVISEVVTEARAQLFNPDSGEYVSEDAELIDWMYEGYVELYGLEPEWTPVAVEYPFQIPLLDENGEPSNYQIKGKIDVILRDKIGRASCRE